MHLKEHQYHTDLRPGDRLMYFTTCGWMMWNWLLSALASGATVVCLRRQPVPSRADRAVRRRRAVPAHHARRVGQVHRRLPQDRRPVALSTPMTSPRCARSAPPGPAPRRRVRVGVRPRDPRRAPGVDLRRHRPVRLLRRRRSDCAGLGRRDPGAGTRHGRRRARRARRPVPARRRRRAGVPADVPVGAARLLGRRRRRPLPGRLLRTLRRLVDPGRLRCTWTSAPGRRSPRHDHPRTQRRHAERRRGAHRHRRDLPGGRTPRRGRRVRRRRPALGRRHPHRALRAPRRRRRRSTTTCVTTIRSTIRSSAHPGTCRRASSRSPTSPAPAATRSASSPWPTWSTAASATPRPSPTPRRSPSSSTVPNSRPEPPGRTPHHQHHPTSNAHRGIGGIGSGQVGAGAGARAGSTVTGMPVMWAWLDRGSKLSGPMGNSTLGLVPGCSCATVSRGLTS
jgi:hypothetical protein